MVFRDQGPKDTLPYGVSMSRMPIRGEEELANPDAGAVAQYFQDKPLQKFLAASGVAIVSGALAGRVVKSGGQFALGKAVRSAAQNPGGNSEKFLQSYRDIQKVLDEYGGILARTKGEHVDEFGRTVTDPTQDTVIRRGFFLTEGEKQYAREQGLPSVAEQTLRDTLQQQLVRSARRAPYELPAAYVVQRGLTDRMLGVEDDDKPNWTNPIDVIGDFAEQSMKNMAFSFLPFEGAGAAAKHGWNKALTNSANANYHGVQKVARDAVVDVHKQLSRVGQDFTDISAQAIRFSRRTTGAAANSIVDSAAKQRGLVDHLNMIRKQGGAEWFNKVLGGEESIGPIFQARDVFTSFKKNFSQYGRDPEHLDDVYASVFKARGTSKFEELVDSVSRLKYKGEQFTKATFREGEFYQKIADSEYKKLVQRNLVDVSGADEDIVSNFVSQASFSRAGAGADLTNRIRFGGDILDDDIHTGLQRLLGPMYEEPQVDKISENIKKAMSNADRQFEGMRADLDRMAKSAWDSAYGDAIAPQARAVLGVKKARYADFSENISSDNAEFLVRRTAERLDIPLSQGDGAQVSTSALRKQIKARGLNADNKYAMRGYLVDQGDITKPWNASGRGIFGIAPLTVGDAYRSGYFDDSAQAGDIRDFMRQVGKSDWDKTLVDRMKLGGVYKTSSGRVFDFNPVSGGTRKFMDRLRDEVQIPFIHTRPGQLLFSKRERDLVQFNTTGRQPFAPDVGDDSVGQMWFRTNRRGGNLANITYDRATSASQTNFLQGTYRSISTNISTFHGENLRLAMGDTGRYGTRDTGTRRGRAANFFGVDEYQPDSLADWARRFRNRPNDLNSQSIFGRRLEDAGSVNNLVAQTSQREVAEGAQNMFRFWRTQSFSKNLQRLAPQADGEDVISSLFRIEGSQIGLGRGMVDMRDLDSKQLSAAIKRKFHSSTEDMPDDVAQLVEKTRNNLLRRWTNVDDFEASLSAGKRSLGLQRVKDEALLDFMKYNAIEGALAGPQGSYDTLITRLMRQVDEMAGSGAIGRTEAAEARATVGSMNQLYRSIKFYDPTVSRSQNVLDTLDDMLGQGTRDVEKNMRQIIRDTYEYQTEGHVRGGLASRFSTSKYEFQGTEVNPFGGENVFVPTFGTVFSRDPAAAIKSALGFSTWSNPEAFSTSGLAISQGVTRVNDALSVMNARVGGSSFMAPDGFKGPLDLLARGMVGSRMLPAYAAGATFMAADRTLGAYVYNDKDEEGNRIYKPLVTSAVGAGIAELQVAGAGILPGGKTADQKRHEIYEGDVEVRRGRWWPLGKTPWKGGKVEYYRPSWYQRLTSGYQYTDQTFGSPVERLMFGYDFSPLRPLDPYRFEREQGRDRPYPVSGDYFTGPWGPLTPVLNMTVGRLLKPKVSMYEGEVAAELGRFQPVGDFGMAPPSSDQPMPGEPVVAGGGLAPGVGEYTAAAGIPAYTSGSMAAGNELMAGNERYLQAVGIRNTAAMQQAYPYIPAGGNVGATSRTPNNVVQAMQPISVSGISNQSKEFAYRVQEFAGIYGFGFGAVRENLGLGSMEYESAQPMFAEAGQAYGASRQFWDLNLGGLGDVPTPLEGEYANFEASEIIRRFIPKPRNLNLINPIQNNLGVEQPWLPGADYFINFKRGDPYVKVPEGEMRLPGTGYERFNDVQRDPSGQYSAFDQFKILADVAPYSTEFQQASARIANENLSPTQMAEYQTTLAQVAKVKQRHEFSPYEHQDENILSMRRWGEKIAHMDTYFNNKFLPERTAREDWERNYVYGTSFPQWQNPYQDFIKPMAYKASHRDPLAAAAGLGIVGSLIGASKEAKSIGTLVGAMTGLTISTATRAREKLTGERYIPAERRRELAVEEYADILEYTKSLRGFNMAQQAGDARTAQLFQRQMKSTMYGADIYGGTAEELAQAIPKRKREHFMQFLNAPESERPKILSTAGRLERRIYQAAWGQKVEARPDLGEYFENHELPGPDWEGWDPRVSMEQVKIKMLQQQGLNMSQMGYYPQQIMEANLVNPSYPNFNSGTNNTRAELQRLMELSGMSGGSVRAIPTPYSGTNVEFINGV